MPIRTVTSVVLTAMLCAATCPADIYRRDNGEVIPGTEGMEPGPGIQLPNARLYNADLAGANLSGANFHSARLHGADVTNTNLTNADLSGANLNDALLRDADVSTVSFSGANITGINLTNSRVAHRQLYATESYRLGDLRGVQLVDSDLRAADFSNQNLTGADLSGAELGSSSFAGANLTGARVDRAILADSEFVNATLDQASLFGVDLSNANLSQANLVGGNLSSSVLQGATLDDAILRSAKLANVTHRGFTSAQLYATASYQTHDLRGIDLSDNDLAGWDFSGQDLSNASLRYSDLTSSNLQNTNLRGADLRDAVGFSPAATTDTRNAILPGDRIEGLEIRADEQLILPSAYSFERGEGEEVVISIDKQMTINTGGALEMNATCFFGSCRMVRAELALDASVDLGGTLRLIASSRETPHTWQLFRWPQPLATDNEFDRIELPVGAWDVSQLYTTGEIKTLRWYQGDGDFDVDEDLDVADLDRLSIAVRSGRDLSYDLDFDGIIDTRDRDYWLHEIKQTWFGDANLDGEFNSSDLIVALAAGTYEADVEAGWASGDFDGSGEFDSSDLIYALADGGYEQGPRAAVASVPEPTTAISLLMALITLAGVSQSRRKAS